MSSRSCLLCIAISFLIFACRGGTERDGVSEAQQAAVIDSAKAVVQSVFTYIDKLDFPMALKFFSGDPDASFIDNGSMFPSLDAMKKAYDQLQPAFESLHTTIDSWNTVVLASDAVLFTLPVHFIIKAKGRPEYSGQYIWSGVVQKRNGKWIIIHSHESWLNYAEGLAAITPVAAK